MKLIPLPFPRKLHEWLHLPAIRLAYELRQVIPTRVLDDV